jgi:hypothetical protein
MLQVRGRVPPLSWIDLALLLAGAGATLWAYTGGRQVRDGAPAGERVTGRAKLALGLLVADLCVDLSSGRVAEAVQQFGTLAGRTNFLLSAPAFILVLLGTGAATVTFRSGSPLLSGPGSPLRRLGPRVKGTLAALGLALSALVLAAVLAPDPGLYLGLVLLTLGIGAGLLALFHQARAPAGEDPAAWGIAPRGWVSLALLGAAGLVLGTQEIHYLGSPGGSVARLTGKSRAADPAPVVATQDAPSTWSMRFLGPPPLTPPEKAKEENRWRATLRKPGGKPEKPEFAPSPPAPQAVGDQSGGARTAPGGAGTTPGDGGLAHLAELLVRLDRRIADLESAVNSVKPNNPPAPSPTAAQAAGDQAAAARKAPAGDAPSAADGGLARLERLMESLGKRITALEEAKTGKPADKAVSRGGGS